MNLYSSSLMLTLDVAISTYRREGILRVEKMLPSPQKGVRYVVSWQAHGNEKIPENLSIRSDIEIHRFDIAGLSNNRNNALDYCKSDIVLIADDDLVYSHDFADKVRKAFYDYQDLDLAIFRIDFPNPKTYPEQDCVLSFPLPKNFYCCSVEIAFRRERIGDLKFWPGMGLGSKRFQCGEDELFVLAAIKRGLKCRFVNKVIACHPEESTGTKISSGILRGQGFILGRMYPLSCNARIPLKAYRLTRWQEVSFFKAVFHLSIGAFLSKVVWRRIPKCYKW